MKPTTIEDIVDFAIAAEVEASHTYRDLASKVKVRELRDLLLAIAAQEDSHREALERVREGDLSIFATDVGDVEVSVPLGAPPLGPDLSPPQLLLAAIDAERQACQLYSQLAAAAADPGLTTLLEALAREETRHWQQLEQAYDAMVRRGLSLT